MDDLETNGLGLLEFLDWVSDSGLLISATVTALKTSSLKVLQATENWESRPISHHSLNDYIARFKRMNQGDFQERTLEVYAARFRETFDVFLCARAEGPGWKPKTRTHYHVRHDDQDDLAQEQKTCQVTYPFPLRADLLLELTLPKDLTADEARRITAFIAALAVSS